MIAILIVCVVTKVTIANLGQTQWPVEVRKLFTPSLEEIAQVLNEKLTEHYKEVHVDVVDCPDLKETPFTLAASGLNGNTRIISTGDNQYAKPISNLTKVYDIRDVVNILNMKSAFVIGAQNGPRQYTGTNCDGVCNIHIDGDNVIQQSRAIISLSDELYTIKTLPKNETRFDTQGDHFASLGQPGPVLRVHVRKRIGMDAFSVSIRKVLAEHFGNKTVGLGGTIVIKQGKALHLIASEFPKSFDQDTNWLKRYNMMAPLISVGIIVTGYYDLNLRRQHFHSFSYHEDGGHYVTDTTPEITEYIGYFNTAEYIYRIDKPEIINEAFLLIIANSNLF